MPKNKFQLREEFKLTLKDGEGVIKQSYSKSSDANRLEKIIDRIKKEICKQQKGGN